MNATFAMTSAKILDRGDAETRSQRGDYWELRLKATRPFLSRIDFSRHWCPDRTSLRNPVFRRSGFERRKDSQASTAPVAYWQPPESARSGRWRTCADALRAYRRSESA